MNRPLCIYHGNCADGFAAAWAVREALGDIEFHAGVHQDLPPDVKDRDVIMVDFSYKRPVITEMAKSARTILILDHHKSAAEDLCALPAPITIAYDPDALLAWAQACNGPPVYAVFDMARSGAGIAWDYFHPHSARPPLIDHIEDRDLWRFKLPGTREIQAALFSYPYDFGTWSKLMQDNLQNLWRDGEAIERKHHKDIAELVKVVTRLMVIGGHVVPMANMPYTMTSDAGHLLALPPYPFAGCYWDTPDGRVFSLRSRNNGMDVSEIAQQYGGGGHRNAAGFRVPYHRLQQFEIELVEAGIPGKAP